MLSWALTRNVSFQSRPWYMPQPDGMLSSIMTKLSVVCGIREFPPGPQFESEGYYIQEMVSYGGLSVKRDLTYVMIIGSQEVQAR